MKCVISHDSHIHLTFLCRILGGLGRRAWGEEGGRPPRTWTNVKIMWNTCGNKAKHISYIVNMYSYWGKVLMSVLAIPLRLWRYASQREQLHRKGKFQLWPSASGRGQLQGKQKYKSRYHESKTNNSAIFLSIIVCSGQVLFFCKVVCVYVVRSRSLP